MASQDVCLATEQLDRLESLGSRLRGEFVEMPDLRLTAAQARRLWGLDYAECQQVLDGLVGTGFLKRTPDGLYQRR